MAELSGYFAVHSQGLGHASRALALARDLTTRRPDVYVLFLAGSPALDLIVANGFDAMPLPPAPDWPAANGVLGPVWRWYLEYARYLRVARRFLRREADWAHFRFLISDSELASIREAIQHQVPTAAILNAMGHDFARDLPSRLAEGYGNRGLARLARRTDLVLVSGPAPAWSNVREIGPIARGFTASRETLREDFFFRKKTILVTAGGTSIGGFLLQAAIRAFRELELKDASMIIVSGPKLQASPAPGVYTYGFVPNLQDYILAADLVITTAGKGTVHEALAAGTPVIAIPPKGHAEAERNAANLGFTHEDVRRLKELIPEQLSRGRREPRSLDNERAVAHLVAFLETLGRVRSRPQEGSP